MIGSLRGVLAERIEHGEILLDVGGVGYRVLVPTGVAAGLGTAGATVAVYVHTHVREDAIVLFGFETREQRTCFEALIEAHGVGPSLALSVLSALTPAELCSAVADEDIEVLTSVPGIGRKTAARLVIDLRSRLASLEVDLAAAAAAGSEAAAASAGLAGTRGAVHANGRAPGANGAGTSANGARAHSEVRAALAELGYSADEARSVVRRLPREGTVEDLLREALRSMGAAR